MLLLLLQLLTPHLLKFNSKEHLSAVNSQDEQLKTWISAIKLIKLVFIKYKVKKIESVLLCKQMNIEQLKEKQNNITVLLISITEIWTVLFLLLNFMTSHLLKFNLNEHFFCYEFIKWLRVNLKTWISVIKLSGFIWVDKCQQVWIKWKLNNWKKKYSRFGRFHNKNYGNGILLP